MDVHKNNVDIGFWVRHEIKILKKMGKDNLKIWMFVLMQYSSRLSIAHILFTRFVNYISAFHSSPVLDLISTLNLFDLVPMVGICLMMRWWDRFWAKTREHIEKEVYQRYQERVTSYSLNYKINKAHWACVSYRDPKTCSWFFDLLFWLRGYFAFPKK